MLHKTVVLAASLALMSLVRLSWGQSEQPPVITGTITYLQPSALPPDAIVNVQLQHTSLQDVPAKVVGEAKIATEGKQVPIPFRISYAPADINPAHTYVVRATIMARGEMMFTSPVPTRSSPAAHRQKWRSWYSRRARYLCPRRVSRRARSISAKR